MRAWPRAHLSQQVIGQRADVIPGVSLVQVNAGPHRNGQKLHAGTQTSSRYWKSGWPGVSSPPRGAAASHKPGRRRRWAATPGGTETWRWWRRWSSAAEASWSPGSAGTRAADRRHRHHHHHQHTNGSAGGDRQHWLTCSSMSHTTTEPSQLADAWRGKKQVYKQEGSINYFNFIIILACLWK